MADFTEVHFERLKGSQRLKPGDIWQLMLREPLKVVQSRSPSSLKTSQLIRLIKCEDRKLRPATAADREIVQDWKTRYALTPFEAFMLPEELRSKKTTVAP
jgi:hypothetical protein